jgi:hypothetical protein
MNQKFILCIVFLLTTGLGFIIATSTPTIANQQQVFATLLEGDNPDNEGQQQDDLGIVKGGINKDFIKDNNDNNDRTSEDVIPKSQSDIVMQDLNDNQLLDRIMPIIIKKINLTVTQRDTGRVTLDPTRYLGVQDVRADCNKNEIATGGGYKMSDVDSVTTSAKDGNSWLVKVWHPNKLWHPLRGDFGSAITVYVECLKPELK